MEGEGRREGRGGRARYCFTVSTAAPLAPSSPSRSLSFASSASMCSEVLFGVSRSPLPHGASFFSTIQLFSLRNF